MNEREVGSCVFFCLIVFYFVLLCVVDDFNKWFGFFDGCVVKFLFGELWIFF